MIDRCITASILEHQYYMAKTRDLQLKITIKIQRVYSVLWGTLLLDFESEEESKTSLTPRQTSEVLGISEWDGQGRGSNSYPNGLLLVTHTGTNLQFICCLYAVTYF